MEAKLISLLHFVASEGRVCPHPQYWNKLWKTLRGNEENDIGYRLPPPLILAAWWHSSNADKQARLREHIEYAAIEGRLDEVDSYLRKLPLSRWHVDASKESKEL
jgi:hypothetical protein